MNSRIRASLPRLGILAWAAALACSLSLTGCGGGDLPPSTSNHGVPLAGIAPGTIGLIRVDLAAASPERLGSWLRTSDPRKDPYLRSLLLARERLLALGFTAVVAPIPAPDLLPDDIGIYLAGPEGVDRERVEEAFLEAGGLTALGLAASMSFAIDLGKGWYFYGFGEDGILESVDRDRAVAFARELAVTPSAAFTAVLLAPEGGMVVPASIPQGEARAVRRLRAMLESVNRVETIVITGGGDRPLEWRFRFGSADDVEFARTAVTKVLSDVKLMASGSDPGVDVDRLDALGWRRLAESHDIRVEGKILIVTPR